MRESIEMESSLHELAVEIERARAENDQTGAALLAERARDLKLDLSQMHAEAEQRRQALRRSRAATKLDILRAEATAARASGDLEQARMLEEALEMRLHEEHERAARVADLKLHQATYRSRKIELQLKLEKLERMKLETNDEMLWRDDAVEELRLELDKLHEHDSIR
jgi:hypothetical protein